MTRQRRRIATAMKRLREYLAIGGRPLIYSNGALGLAIFPRREWNQANAARRQEIETVYRAFFFITTGHPDAAACVKRAVQKLGKPTRFGTILLSATIMENRA